MSPMALKSACAVTSIVHHPDHVNGKVPAFIIVKSLDMAAK